MNIFKAIGAAITLVVLTACATAADRPGATIEAGPHIISSDIEQVALFESTLRQNLNRAGFSEGPGLTVRYRLVQYNPGIRILQSALGNGMGQGALVFEITYLDASGAELSRTTVGAGVEGSLNQVAIAAARQAANYASEHYGPPRARRRTG